MATHKAEPHPIHGPLPPSLFIAFPSLAFTPLIPFFTPHLSSPPPLSIPPPSLLLCHRRARTVDWKDSRRFTSWERGTAASLHVFAVRRQAEHYASDSKLNSELNKYLFHCLVAQYIVVVKKLARMSIVGNIRLATSSFFSTASSLSQSWGCVICTTEVWNEWVNVAVD